MDIFVLLLIFLCFIFLWYYFTKHNENRKTKLINEFPGPVQYPVVGTALPIIAMKKHEKFTYIRSLPKNFGTVYRTWNGNIPVVNIADPEYAEIILNSSVHITKGFAYRYTVPWLGDGLLTSTGSKWHRQRKLLTPAFHFKILETFMDVFLEKTKLFVEMLSHEAEKKEPFNIFPYITRCTLDMITETAMGIKTNNMMKQPSKYTKAIYGICEKISDRMARGWLSSDFVYYKTVQGRDFLKYVSTLHNVTNSVIDERKKTLTENQTKFDSDQIKDDFGIKKRDAFLDILLKASKNYTVLTHEQIREEVDTFMFEGHDTTTASICWTIFLLGLHPHIQEETYKEISEVLQDDDNLTFSDVNKLKYLERVLKESLRLYPSVTHISRRLTEDVKLDKYTIPSGTTTTILIHDIHRNPKYFPEPDNFDPDRFLPENCEGRHPFAYIPFSAGPRNCIGQRFALTEEKVMLSYVIKNFKIKSMQTEDNVYPVTELILRPLDGLYVTLEKRT